MSNLNGLIILYTKAHFVLLRDFLESNIQHTQLDKHNVKNKLKLLLEALNKEAVHVNAIFNVEDSLEQNALQLPFYHISTITEAFLNILVKGLYNKDEEVIRKLYHVLENFDKIKEIPEKEYEKF